MLKVSSYGLAKKTNRFANYNGAGDEIRTHDIYLGKVTLYP